MNIVVCILIIFFYTLYGLRKPDITKDFINSIIYLIDRNLVINPLIGYIIFGICISIVAYTTWILFLLLIIVIIIYYWFTDKNKLKNIFKI